jgi:hypothetical protein
MTVCDAYGTERAPFATICATSRATKTAHSQSNLEIAMTDSPPDKKKLVVFGLCVAGLSLFMYVSFIAKVAFDGP